MTIDVSGFGSGVTIVATKTFPFGFTVESFADDEDPIIAEPVEPTGYEMCYDGSLFAFDKAAAVKVGLSVVPNSADDINLKIMLQARKGSASIIPLPDITIMVVNYPDGGRVILSAGTILSGPVMDGVQSSGRKKSNTYYFAFGSFDGMQSAKQVVAGLIQFGTSLF